MEYNGQRFTLNNRCEFAVPDDEAAFVEREETGSLNTARILTLCAGVIFAAFVLSDYRFFGAGRGFYISAALRGTALLAAAAAFLLADKFARRGRTFLLITAAELSVFFIYLAILRLGDTIEPAPPGYIPPFMCAALFILAAFLIPNKWKNSVIAGCVIAAGYIIFAAVFPGAVTGPSGELPAAPAAYPASLAAAGAYLAVCLASCAVILRGKENARRKQFAAERLLERASITDRLTGIYNRGRFEYVLSLWIKNMRHDPFCLIFFRLDKAGKQRRRSGRGAGNEALIKITEVIAAHIRDNDVFARMEDEAFAVLLDRVDEDKAGEIAGRLKNAVGSVSPGKAGHITISAAQYRRLTGRGEETIAEFIHRAAQNTRGSEV